MSSGSKWLSLVFVAGALVTPLVTTGCGGHRVYDPYYSDYHRWDSHENVYYQQWIVEGHRDPHRDYKHLNKDEQKQYWDWRHSHGDHH
jgi:hypothetical protein